jgi:hypothetical protein
MEDENSVEEDLPLMSEEIEKREIPSTSTRIPSTLPKTSSKDGQVDEDEFESLLNLHKTNSVLSGANSYFFGILPIVLFVGVCIFFFHSSLNVPQVSRYGTHGGLIGAAFLGVLLVYLPSFYVWRSSIRDRRGTPTLALPFKVLGWLILLISFFVSFIYFIRVIH